MQSESWEGGGFVGGWDQVKEMQGKRRRRKAIAFFCHICSEETLPTSPTGGASFSPH